MLGIKNDLLVLEVQLGLGCDGGLTAMWGRLFFKKVQAHAMTITTCIKLGLAFCLLVSGRGGKQN